MNFSALYLQRRMQILERHVSTVLQVLRLDKPDTAEELADLERIWQAECEALHVAFLNRNRAYFDTGDEGNSRRKGGGDDWDPQ